jgi:hypothetical protein
VLAADPDIAIRMISAATAIVNSRENFFTSVERPKIEPLTGYLLLN